MLSSSTAAEVDKSTHNEKKHQASNSSSNLFPHVVITWKMAKYEVPPGKSILLNTN